MSPRPYWNPYLAGVGLGLTLAIAYLVLGTGLGASGAITRTATTALHAVAPATVEANATMGGYYEGGGSPLHNYLVWMFAGVLAGGFLSAAAASRVRVQVERGPRISAGGRIALTLLGGALAGLGARFAGGCTSGLALSGGAMLQAGAMVFVMTTFGAAFGLAPLLKRAWR
ncbi:MAG: YeeE/YedE family protein [Planctomycetes bacterium]|nr:YeeE/YedE family protein [Planctomycetota bacterium]MCB9885497.1 YeeE/YedE family protein [Planctomycetota bacterium]